MSANGLPSGECMLGIIFTKREIQMPTYGLPKVNLHFVVFLYQAWNTNASLQADFILQVDGPLVVTIYQARNKTANLQTPSIVVSLPLGAPILLEGFFSLRVPSSRLR